MRVARNLLMISVVLAAYFLLSIIWPADQGPPVSSAGDVPTTTTSTVTPVAAVPPAVWGGDETLQAAVDLHVWVTQAQVNERIEQAELLVQQTPVEVGPPHSPAAEPTTPEPQVEVELAEPVTVEAGSIEDLICSYGWDCATALRVAECESGLNPGAVGGAGEKGVFQIHPVHAPRLGARWGQMFDPAANVQVAFEMWSSNGWRPWSCY